MKIVNIRKIVNSALFAAMVCVSTLVIQMPIPGGGYVNLGDAFVLLSGFILGPVYGGVAAAIGSSVADLVAFPAYAPATFVIKFFMAFFAGLIFRKNKSMILCFIGALVGEVIMVLGYFAYEALFLGLGIGASVSVPFNTAQGLIGAFMSCVLVNIFLKNKSLRKRFGL